MTRPVPTELYAGMIEVVAEIRRKNPAHPYEWVAEEATFVALDTAAVAVGAYGNAGIAGSLARVLIEMAVSLTLAHAGQADVDTRKLAEKTIKDVLDAYAQPLDHVAATHPAINDIPF